MCPTRGETARALGPNTGTRCRFSAQYWITATPREASGSASGGSMTIFAGGSVVASGITGAGRHLSLAFCATAVMAYKTMAATASRNVAFDLLYFGFAMFFPPMRSPKSQVRFVECERQPSESLSQSVTFCRKYGHDHSLAWTNELGCR